VELKRRRIWQNNKKIWVKRNPKWRQNQIKMNQKLCNELICNTFAPATEELANMHKDQLPAEIIGYKYFNNDF
jgi:hypothetical protein